MHRTMWEFRQSAEKSDNLELYIYSTVESDGFWWNSETSARHFKDELAKHPNAKEITVYINSLGGSVMEGIAIYNQLKRHPAHVTVQIDGFACSIASVIAMAGDKVIMPKNTVMMIHNAWTIAVGNSRELHKAADDLEVINQASRQAYLDKAGDKLSEEKLTELLDGETYLTAEQCMEYGLIDSYGGDEEDGSGADPAQLTGMTVQQRMEQELMQRREKAVAALNKYFG
ncbi:MAG: Clp protease ClpP [Lachnospiraceae bacterium]|nr:Clp protease ClpP [Lachnospiraceae bacterium]